MSSTVRVLLGLLCVAALTLVSRDIGGVAISAFTLWLLFTTRLDNGTPNRKEERGRLVLSGRNV